jgi:hypothetical protein
MSQKQEGKEERQEEEPPVLLPNQVETDGEEMKENCNRKVNKARPGSEAASQWKPSDQTGSL